jgi:hypothetical protein
MPILKSIVGKLFRKGIKKSGVRKRTPNVRLRSYWVILFYLSEL